MKKLIMIAAGIAAIVFLGAAPARAALKVVTSTQDLASIAQEVGGDKIKIDALAKGYQDPHFVEAKPSFVLLLNMADLRRRVRHRRDRLRRAQARDSSNAAAHARRHQRHESAEREDHHGRALF